MIKKYVPKKTSRALIQKQFGLVSEPNTKFQKLQFY